MSKNDQKCKPSKRKIMAKKKEKKEGEVKYLSVYSHHAKKNICSIYDAACAIGYNYRALLLLYHLKDTNIKLALDVDFILDRADKSYDAYEEFLHGVNQPNNPQWGMLQQAAEEHQNEVLFAGL
jgi:hypothetical protein